MYREEKQVDEKIKKAVKAAGGLYIKINPTAYNGLPDRLLLWPRGRIEFLELKASAGALSPIQQAQIKRLTRMGYDVKVIRGLEAAEVYIRNIKG